MTLFFKLNCSNPYYYENSDVLYDKIQVVKIFLRQKGSFLMVSKKIPVGLAGVALGSFLYLDANNVHADVTTNTANTTPSTNQTDTTAVLAGTPSASPATTTTTSANDSTSFTTANSEPAGSATEVSNNSEVASSVPSSANSGSSATSDSASESPVTPTSSASSASNSTSDNENTVSLKYYVHDDDNNDKVVYIGTQSMSKGSTISMSALSLPNGYELSGEGTITAGNSDFKADVHAKHQIVKLDAPAPSIIERTIVITNPDGSTKTIKQQGEYTLPASEIDEVTKQTKTLGSAELTGIGVYQVPTIDGYTASEAEVPALTAESYDNGAKLLVNITYTKNGDTPNSSSTPSSNTPASDSNSSQSSASSATSSASSDSNSASSASQSTSNASNASSTASNASNAASQASSAANSAASSAAQSASTSNDSSATSQSSSTQNSASSAANQSADETSSAQPANALVDSNSTNSSDNVSQPSLVSASQMQNNELSEASANDSNKSLPQTGNDNNVANEMAALGLGSLGVVGAMTLKKKKRG